MIKIGGIYDLKVKSRYGFIPNKNIKIKYIHNKNLVESTEGYVYESEKLVLSRKKKLERILNENN